MYGEHIRPIAKLHFTAKVELETVNQLPDGMLITHKTYNLIARDSLGRTHNERRKWIDPTTSEEPKLLRVELYDPATLTRTELFPLTKIARQWIGTPSAEPSAQIAAGKPEISRENIGTDSIQGIPVRGVRVSQTYAAGALGNDRPLKIVTEYWFSEELKINLLTTRTDPRFGVQTVRVTELARQEPEPSLFAISPEYKLVKETLPDQEGRAEAMSDDDSQISVSAPSGVARAGVAGTTIPICIYCPNPSYTDKARTAKIQGSVVLQIVVTADGQAENISVVKGPGLGLGLEESAIKTVKGWRFKPAHGPDGNAVATVVPVQVTFRLR
jgi:TonB family protein